jgi:hypothetical protein
MPPSLRDTAWSHHNSGCIHQSLGADLQLSPEENCFACRRVGCLRLNNFPDADKRGFALQPSVLKENDEKAKLLGINGMPEKCQRVHL